MQAYADARICEELKADVLQVMSINLACTLVHASVRIRSQLGV